MSSTVALEEILAGPRHPGRRFLFTTKSGFWQAVASLHPGSFAFVMATGIVAIAFHLHEFFEVGAVLGAINWVGYCVLAALTILRLTFYGSALIEDFTDHLRSPGFLTLVAGTSVLGAQSIVVEQARVVATILWYGAAGLWALVLYAFLISMAVGAHKPSLGSGINGGWNLLTVATQSIVVLGGLVGARAVPHPAVQFILLAMFFVGGLLYVMTITLIFYRISFFEVTPEEFGPLYWINMGGAAISVLAGATLLQRAENWSILHHYASFLSGAAVCFWAAGTFWIPFLIGMFAWRYLVRADAFRYEVGLWGMVFPLGMYATSTYVLARAESLPFLDPLSLIFAFIGLGAWLATSAAFLVSATERGRPLARM